MVPILALFGIYAGVIGGWLVAMGAGVPTTTFVQSIQQYAEPWDFIGGVLKGPFFGLITAVVACQQGLRTKDGAFGVGKATTHTVVLSMLLIYTANYFLASVLFAK